MAVALTGSFMAVLDTTIVNVALPSIEQGAHATAVALEWKTGGADAAAALAAGKRAVPTRRRR